MKMTTINRRFIVVALLTLVSMLAVAQTQKTDTTSTHLLNEVRKYFNSNNEGAFYIACENYREYYLATGDLPLYYKGWMHEVLYDVNHNHFYRAMRKTTLMRNDMRKRKAETEYYNATHLQGVIFSLRGNITLAHQYFERALEEVDHSRPTNLINIYLDLANIEMDTQPQEAMKHLNCAIDIIKANNGRYEYSDAIGFKVIVAYAMRDWDTLNNAYQEYMKLQDTLGNDFSVTYYHYVKICKNIADHHYGEAIRLTNLLTNSTDQYKFQTEIYEMAGDTAKAFLAQKHYSAVKDSVNNVIMSEEMVGSANDLALAEMQKEECSERSERMKISFIQNMSHEVRTPLNVISGFAQVISDPDNSMSEEERAEMATRIANSSDHIVRIINEILDVSGKESIHYLDKSDSVICNELARKVLQSYQDEYKDIDIRFNSNLKDSFRIITNTQEAEKVLNNLLNNACKFTEQGSVTLSCYQDELEKMVCFSVTDTGKGIKEGEEEKIFEHFYKVDAYKEGVGLGLPLARRIARQLGGDVILDTTYKDGSRFILKLPKEQ